MAGVDRPDPLNAAAEFGPFFAVEVAEPAPGWRPLTDLGTDRAALDDRIDAARSLLIERTGLPPDVVERRVVASVWFLGLAARLVSPPLGAAVRTGTVPDLRPDALWWRPVPAGPLPLRVAPGTPTRSEAALPEIVTSLVDPLVAALRAATRLAPTLLWGNVASSLGGALRVIETTRPADAGPAAALVADLLDRPPLAGTADLDPNRLLRRRTCCLYYRLPGGGTCGDCVLTGRVVRPGRSSRPPRARG